MSGMHLTGRTPWAASLGRSALRRFPLPRARWALPICVAISVLPATFGHPWPANQQVTIRVLNPKSEKPVSKFSITVLQWNGAAADGPFLARDVASSATLRTDRRGKVVVTLADPLPKFITIDCFGLVCSATRRIDVHEVLESGVTLRCDEARGWISRPGGAQVTL